MEDRVRLDKFLWYVRLYKHRTDASAACTKGQILINGQHTKPSSNVMVGAEISVKQFVVYRVYKVIKLLENRVGAPLVKDYITEITSEEDLFKLKMYFELQKSSPKRDKPGRPTKKDRRQLDEFFGD